ncbi:MAG: hypothetical protein IJ889_05370 [Eubacterium sp.]|nr:hypothetical protein [Eubacterium sp.]
MPNNQTPDKYKNVKIVLILLIAAFSVILIAGIILFVHYNKQQNYKEYESAKEQINNGHYKTGIDKIEELLDDGDIPDAEEDAEGILEDAKGKLADQYYREGKPEDAFLLYNAIDNQEGKDKSKLLECKQKILENDLKGAEQIIDVYFEDSQNSTPVKELKYDYCKMSQDPSSDKFAKYLWQLVKAKYKDAKEVNDGFYQPYVKIVVNNSKKDKKHKKYNISIYDTMYFHITMKGLNPNDTKGLKIKTKGVFPDGEAVYYNDKGKWINGTFSWRSMYYGSPGPEKDCAGGATFYVYDTKGNLLGSESANFVN